MFALIVNVRRRTVEVVSCDFVYDDRRITFHTLVQYSDSNKSQIVFSEYHARVISSRWLFPRVFVNSFFFLVNFFFVVHCFFFFSSFYAIAVDDVEICNEKKKKGPDSACTDWYSVLVALAYFFFFFGF
jgi:hypothetical protein